MDRQVVSSVWEYESKYDLYIDKFLELLLKYGYIWCEQDEKDFRTNLSNDEKRLLANDFQEFQKGLTSFDIAIQVKNIRKLYKKELLELGNSGKGENGSILPWFSKAHNLFSDKTDKENEITRHENISVLSDELQATTCDAALPKRNGKFKNSSALPPTQVSSSSKTKQTPIRNSISTTATLSYVHNVSSSMAENVKPYAVGLSVKPTKDLKDTKSVLKATKCLTTKSLFGAKSTISVASSPFQMTTTSSKIRHPFSPPTSVSPASRIPMRRSFTSSTGGASVRPTTLSSTTGAIERLTTPSYAGADVRSSTPCTARAIVKPTNSTAGASVRATISSTTGAIVRPKNSSNDGEIVRPTISSIAGAISKPTTPFTAGAIVRLTTSSTAAANVISSTSSNAGAITRPTNSSTASVIVRPTTPSNSGAIVRPTTPSNSGAIVRQTTSSTAGANVISNTSSTAIARPTNSFPVGAIESPIAFSTHGAIMSPTNTPPNEAHMRHTTSSTVVAPLKPTTSSTVRVPVRQIATPSIVRAIARPTTSSTVGVPVRPTSSSSTVGVPVRPTSSSSTVGVPVRPTSTSSYVGANVRLATTSPGGSPVLSATSSLLGTFVCPASSIVGAPKRSLNASSVTRSRSSPTAKYSSNRPSFSSATKSSRIRISLSKTAPSRVEVPLPQIATPCKTRVPRPAATIVSRSKGPIIMNAQSSSVGPSLKPHEPATSCRRGVPVSLAVSHSKNKISPSKIAPAPSSGVSPPAHSSCSSGVSGISTRTSNSNILKPTYPPISSSFSILAYESSNPGVSPPGHQSYHSDVVVPSDPSCSLSVSKPAHPTSSGVSSQTYPSSPPAYQSPKVDDYTSVTATSSPSVLTTPPLSSRNEIPLLPYRYTPPYSLAVPISTSANVSISRTSLSPSTGVFMSAASFSSNGLPLSPTTPIYKSRLPLSKTASCPETPVPVCTILATSPPTPQISPLKYPLTP